MLGLCSIALNIVIALPTLQNISALFFVLFVLWLLFCIAP
jgi:hypothetical protein